MKNASLISLIIFGLNLTTNAQSSKKAEKEFKKEEQYQRMLKLINTEHYGFRGSKAKPQVGSQIDLTTRSNQLTINNGSAAADLPYFGRAYSGGYSSSDSGIKFDEEMESYDVSKNDKKHKAIIKFKIKGTDDTYTCTLSITGPNSAFLSVGSNKRQIITYTGIIHEIDEEKPKEE